MTVHYETTRNAPATPQRAWEVLTDVERWPRLIAVYQTVRRLDDGPLAVGSRVEVKQKGLRAGTWEVTELDAGHSFTWENRQPGVTTVGRHIVTDRPGGVQIDLRLDQTGWLAGPVALVLGGKARSYVDAEADALAAAAAGPAVRG